MLPSEIRALLLAQHAAVRSLTARVLRLLDATAPPPPTELRGAVESLQRAITEHNRDEQRLLGELLPVADAWGEVRRAAMDEHHREEHAALRGALGAALDQDDVAGQAAAFRRLVADLHAHMEVEERVLLSAHVLRDDPITIEIGA